MKDKIEYLYFCSFSNLKTELFDYQFFSTSFDSKINVKIYEPNIDNFSNLRQISDIIDMLFLKKNDNTRPYLFASEFVLTCDFFEKDFMKANLNVAEKYRIRKTTANVFDYVNSTFKTSEIKYLKLALKDSIFECSEPNFYICNSNDFSLMNTQSLINRLAGESVFQSSLLRKDD